MITSESIIRVLVAAVLCPVLLYGADRALLFHASLFRSEFSGDNPDRLFRKRPKVITGRAKLVALVLTTLAFCATVLTDGKLVAPVAVSVAGFLTFMGLSFFETLRALKKLQRGR